MQSKKVKTSSKQIFQFAIVGLVVFGFSFYFANVSNAQEEYQYTTQISDVKTVKLPNDPGFTKNGANIDKQWGLVKAGFLKAWEKTTGSKKVIVAVIDTGVDATHIDFKKTKFVTGYNALTDKTISARSNSDDNGHGTLVAGVIAASTNNDIGIAGAAYGVSIMPIKALNDSGSGGSAQIAEAIIWAADHKANIINLSLGGLGFAHDKVLANAITYAFDKNIVIIAAAGNDVAVTGGNLDVEPVFPICNDNGKNMIIGVTATDVNDLKPSFANYGKACVDVSAPGRRIISTINHDPATGGELKNAYAYASGTSLAVPFVSAQAGLLKSLFPEASNRQIRDRIIATSENIDKLNISQCAGSSCQGLLGGGRINVDLSLQEQIITVKDGDVVTTAGSLNFYFINGGKRQMISPFVKNQKFKNYPVKTIPNSDLEGFTEGSYAEPLDGTLVKMPNDNTIFYIETGLRRPVTGQVFTARGYRFADVVTLTNVEVNSWIVGSFLTPPDGGLVRGLKNPTIYYIVNGSLHPVSAEYFASRELGKLPMIKVPDSEIAKYPKGDAYLF